jgi:hypothetical protein
LYVVAYGFDDEWIVDGKRYNVLRTGIYFPEHCQRTSGKAKKYLSET